MKITLNQQEIGTQNGTTSYHPSHLSFCSFVTISVISTLIGILVSTKRAALIYNTIQI